ncbi:hypothetical protein LCGC14_2068400 [marine sediment metagenome]|uniref:HNH nuclease domain-containing protein n=1 Tax=marine sediment metagenome TaxID=412755 RepID=A0A0F9GXI9_9ZZZZ
MPEVGVRVQGKEIGKTGFNAKRGYVYLVCSTCGEGRWARQYDKRKGESCLSCTTGLTRRKVAGQHRRTSSGYTKVKVDDNDFFYPMVDKEGYIREHRLVMARKLGRLLLPQEQVHHINGIKDDNRRENLELVSAQEHSIYNQLCGNCPLRKEIRLLRWQVRELNSTTQSKLS